MILRDGMLAEVTNLVQAICFDRDVEFSSVEDFFMLLYQHLFFSVQDSILCGNFSGGVPEIFRRVRGNFSGGPVSPGNGLQLLDKVFFIPLGIMCSENKPPMFH